MAINPRSLQNIKPPKKGEVRNPTGRNGFSNEFRTMLAKAATEEDFVAITETAIRLARAGNTDIIKFILEKTYPRIEKLPEIKVTIEDAREHLIKLLAGEKEQE